MVEINGNKGTVMSADDILLAGLSLAFTQKRINNVNGDPKLSKTNIQRFKDHFGARPHVVSQIWQDLLATAPPIPEERDPNLELSIKYVLESLNFLYRCKRESEREAVFDKSPKDSSQILLVSLFGKDPSINEDQDCFS